ncbi:S8 family peptidase (plasmid) [Streptomyces sp. HUAS TT11]|uniref:S8 family peptidase n=1 Tax=Streptomyces sp. HUAS TT11 TaxID=3447508 RepID=UPI003F65C367
MSFPGPAAAVGPGTVPAGGQSAASGLVTLITGDRITVDKKGAPLAVTRAEGREHIPIRTLEANGHQYAVPFDAQQLIDTGRLDLRLFDLTTLSEPAYLERQRRGLQLIVCYQGARPAARQELKAAGGPEVTDSFDSFAGDAVRIPRKQAGDAWKTLTDETAQGYAVAAAGVKRIWLDGIAKADLDRSVPQIGAPEAWEAGYDGTGVKVAVLDTGVDKTHPDLADQVVEEKNFTDSPDLKDRMGHGTHVASTVAGTGAKSGGKYRGVAPGAQILAGKVLGDDGWGSDSAVIAGMEWAVAEGADIVNLSLGGEDSPGIDPLEEAVNRLSVTSDTLFVVAAGNDGELGPESVDSPGSADAALTVGAVSKTDELAGFSSTGPRRDDGGMKPDVTAPGVDIAAASAPGSVLAEQYPPVADGYIAISGTSMATPHVAGSAALLKQRHPDWSGELLKGVLSGSATPHNDYTAFQEGTGRIDLRPAMKQTLLAESGPVTFGRQLWPHDDDQPMAREIVYRNLGTEEATLDLAVTGTGPDGSPAPVGLFTLGKDRITVPAGGIASLSVTADSRLGGDAGGGFGGVVTATGSDQSVRTALSVYREGEAYDVTIRHIGRDGGAPGAYSSLLIPYQQSADAPPVFLSSSQPTDAEVRTVRVPAGKYYMSSDLGVATDGSLDQGIDQIVRPLLDVTGDIELKADAREAKPVDVTMSGTPQTFANLTTIAAWNGRTGIRSGIYLDSFTHLRTAHAGPAAPEGSLLQFLNVSFQDGTGTPPYELIHKGTGNTALTGLSLHTSSKDYAKITLRMGRQTLGDHPSARYWATPDALTGLTNSYRHDTLPADATMFIHASSGTKWSVHMEQMSTPDIVEARYSTDPVAYRPGSAHTVILNGAVIGPALPAGTGVFRDGDGILPIVPILADSAGHSGFFRYESGEVVLYRGEKEIGAQEGPPDGAWGPFEVGPEAARYRLHATIQRPAGTYLSSKVTADWTFTSRHTAEETALPVSVVRFAPDLARDNTGAAGKTVRIPVAVEGSAAGRNLKSLTVKVSYDRGNTWTAATVSGGKISVHNPASGGSVSFRADAADKQGNTAAQTITDAYYTK